MGGEISKTVQQKGILWDNIPARLRKRRRWAASRDETRSGGGDATQRVPYQSPAHDGEQWKASVDRARTWGEFDEIRRLVEGAPGDYVGPAFAVADVDRLVAFDLDNVRDPVSGDIAEWATELAQNLGGYWEVSLSGRGLHGFVRCTRVPEILEETMSGRMRASLEGPHGAMDAKLEIYHDRKFLTLTGHVLPGCGDMGDDASAEIAEVCEQHWPALARPTSVAHGPATFPDRNRGF